jgi:transcriptional regulator with XRE-family HTH domain
VLILTFGDRLRQLRSKKGLTQAELARVLSIGESTVSFYESGKRQPDYETLNRLADCFGCSVEYLVSLDLAIDELPVLPEVCPLPIKGRFLGLFVGLCLGHDGSYSIL